MIGFLGPTGTRLRRALPAATVFAVLLSLFVALPTYAVHNTGAFQLDGDAQKSTSPSTAVGTVAPNGDDWDNICASNPLTCTFASGFTASASTTATASAHVSDGAVNASIFTGGGSKDPQDIPNWKWKTDTGGLPAKDNLAHSFAARYSLSSSGSTDLNCPATTSGSDTCKLLYFGSDRIDNSGDAQEGFWFFQNKVTLNSDGTFSGVHAAGDLLILSDFSNGGGTSTINIYKWVASGGDVSTNLQSLGGSTGAACNKVPPLPTNDAFCGLVNANDGTAAPWTFTDKSGNSTYLNGEFYEGGVNLSAPSINLGGECFASFASETRSSTSPTATLKDFVLGGFGQCTSGTETTPSVSGSASIGTGGSVSVSDMAKVTGTGSTTKPTGTVKFWICGPQASNAAAQCDATVAGPSNGVAILPDQTLVPNGGNSSVATSASVAVTSVGHYCFRADYQGDSLYPPSSDRSLTECFEITPVTPTITTSATDSVVLGNPIDDTATLTGTANKPGSPVINPTTAGGAAGGTITFSLYGPSATAICSSAIATRVVNVSGDGNYKASSGSGSGSLTPTSIGTYYWVAIYSGDTPNTNGATSGCGDTGEASVVSDTSSASSEQTWLPNDSATIHTGAGATLDKSKLNGTMTIVLYESKDCSGTAVPGQTYTFTLSDAQAPVTKTTSNTAYSVTVTKDVSWLVTFTPTAGSGVSGSSHCETTSLTITN